MEKCLFVVRSQHFKIPIPDGMDIEDVKKQVLSGKMYSDEWNSIYEEEEVSDFTDDVVNLYHDGEIETLIRY